VLSNLGLSILVAFQYMQPAGLCSASAGSILLILGLFLCCPTRQALGPLYHPLHAPPAPSPSPCVPARTCDTPVGHAPAAGGPARLLAHPPRRCCGRDRHPADLLVQRPGATPAWQALDASSPNSPLLLRMVSASRKMLQLFGIALSACTWPVSVPPWVTMPREHERSTCQAGRPTCLIDGVVLQLIELVVCHAPLCLPRSLSAWATM
jgi:hypothetical protein